MERYFEINENGCNVRCKMYFNDARNIQKVVVFGHGFGGHKDNGAAEKFAQRVLSTKKGLAVITFNWPCHGDDVKKKLHLSDCMSYLDVVVGSVKEKYTTDNIYAYATSFGGYLTLKYIAENGDPFTKIALRCPAVNMCDVLTKTIISSEEYERILKGRDIPVGFDRKIIVNNDFLGELKDSDIFKYSYTDHADDILILQGMQDEVVPSGAVREFADRNMIRFIPVDGADHRFQNPVHMDYAIKSIVEFFEFK